MPVLCTPRDLYFLVLRDRLRIGILKISLDDSSVMSSLGITGIKRIHFMKNKIKCKK